MSFDAPTRNRLAAFVRDARQLLTAEFTQKFQELYGITADGRQAPLGQLAHLDENGRATATLLRERIAYLLRSHPEEAGGPAAAVARLAREQAFTVLNRLAALRLAEKRGLILESVGKGYQSTGFRLYETPAGTGLGDAYHRYRQYLFCLFDELALDLGVLFNRHSPLGLLFPREACLLSLLDRLNAPDLDPLWAEDETIGWIYQYYNDEAERSQMRKESSAPRNSRELAVRNQFFTPRYVVEFLTDNTLGRLWYEMRQGETRLKEQCRYLVRRPTEIFLNPGESAPESAEAGENLSQEELLRQPVHIPHRPLKDPREIRLLDPACGSMHFGLYAFDLFTAIYDEAWEIAHGTDGAAKLAETFAPFVAFAASFSDKAAFLREVPRLIVEHNIHGNDIDPRAAQIAGLSLWLRAQRAWHQAGVKPADRPRITRSNLVCAEPMPGEKELLREFVEQQFPAGERPAFAFLLEKIFDRMTLAGEAGSLLRIEEEIRAAIAEARALAQQQSAPRQARLFPGDERPEQAEFDLRGLNDEQFWQAAEQRIYDALEAYAEQAENGGGFQRRLFADDAAQGFAFIDLCRKRYDVVVMNPPFGEPATAARAMIREDFPNTNDELYASFSLRALEVLCQGGRVGVIASRSGLFLPRLTKWRAALLERTTLGAMIDLGNGVLDSALVETAAYILAGHPDGNSDVCLFADVLGVEDREAASRSIIQAAALGECPRGISLIAPRLFLQIPLNPFAYWVHPDFLALFEQHSSVAENSDEVRIGLMTADDFRFLRLTWELPPNLQAWRPFSKGGGFSPYYDDLHLRVFWDGGLTYWAVPGKEHPPSNIWMLASTVQRHFGRPGVTFTRRSTSGFNPQALPTGALFSDMGPTANSPANSSDELFVLLAVLFARTTRYLVELFAGSADELTSGSAARRYSATIINSLPFPELSEANRQALVEDVRRAVVNRMCNFAAEETSSLFRMPEFEETTSLKAHATSKERESLHRVSEIISGFASCDRRLTESFGVSLGTAHILEEEVIPLLDVQRETAGERISLVSALERDTGDLIKIAKARGIAGRFVTKKEYVADRRCELALLLSGSASNELKSILEPPLPPGALIQTAAEVVSLSVGCIFGRWDIRYAMGERPAPELPDPFAPLPVCPPGMLQGDDGLPLLPEAGRRLRTEGRYPLDVAWDGILVDDPEHPLDLERRVRAALAVLWGDRADGLEHEACALLGVQTLREWFRRPAGFFADHLKRYSKSRRQAPIYWPLATASGSYTLWLYYHRLNAQTLHRAIADFLDPKIKGLEHEITALRERPDGGGRKVGDLLDLQDELKALRAELERVAKLPWRPNLNDGVLITASPLWKLFRLPKWRKDLEACWKELERGDYDWAHLAYTLRPDHVRERCKTDRSLAIAHGLEEICTVQPPARKTRKSRKASQQLEMEATD